MAALLADENMPSLVADELTRLGHDVLTMLQAGLAGQAIPDDEVVRQATAINRCVLTLNRKDFIRLHSNNSTHSGIIVCTFDMNFIALAGRIHRVITESDGLAGQLLRVQKPNLLA